MIRSACFHWVYHYLSLIHRSIQYNFISLLNTKNFQMAQTCLKCRTTFLLKFDPNTFTVHNQSELSNFMQIIVLLPSSPRRFSTIFCDYCQQGSNRRVVYSEIKSRSMFGLQRLSSITSGEAPLASRVCIYVQFGIDI